MSNSILTSTKKILGLSEEYTAFDLDVVTHINSAFSFLSQIGIPDPGNPSGFFIDDETSEWGDLELPAHQLQMVKSYIYLRVRYAFDPPGTSFLIDATKNQIAELEWRLRLSAEYVETVPELEPEPII